MEQADTVSPELPSCLMQVPAYLLPKSLSLGFVAAATRGQNSRTTQALARVSLLGQDTGL